MRWSIGCAIIALLFCSPFAPHNLKAGEPTSSPDLQKLVEAGQRTMAKLATTAASWTAIQEINGDVEVRVTVHCAPTMMRYSINVWKGDQQQSIGDIIMRDGAWFVDELGWRSKCRPYEASTKNPNLYLFLERAAIHAADSGLLEGQPSFEVISDGVATFRFPLTESHKNQLTRVLHSFDQLAAQMTKHSTTDSRLTELKNSRRLVTEMLNRGMPAMIEVESGLVVQSGIIGKRVWWRGFQWQEKIDTSLFAVDDREWTDLTTPMIVDDPANLIAIKHCAMWQPGQPAGALEAELLNIKTGKYRRIPFIGADCVPLCFSKDRKCIYVGGLIVDEGALTLFEVNLQTFEQRRLGQPMLDRVPIVVGAMSPDGKTLAVACGLATENILQSQIVLVDVVSGQAKKLGEPLDCGHLSWLPDGTGLVLLSRKYSQLNESPDNMICRMDLAGRITPLLKGEMPVSLTPRSKILYLAPEDKKWMVCDLDGRNSHHVMDGLADFNFPTPAPDGQRLLMMKFGGSDGPRPYMIDLVRGQMTPINVEHGLWAMPVW